MRIAERSEPSLAQQISGLPLSIAFADGEAISLVRDRGHGDLELCPPYHVSDSDAYLVLPDDIGLELVDIFRDGDLELVHEAMRDGIVAIGEIETRKGSRARSVTLSIEVCARAADVLSASEYGATVTLARGTDPVSALNELDHVQCTVASRFVDHEGLAQLLGAKERAGYSWRPSSEDRALAGVDPTFAWSKRLGEGRVGIECALFCEYEELVVVLRPAVIAAERPRFAVV